MGSGTPSAALQSTVEARKLGADADAHLGEPGAPPAGSDAGEPGETAATAEQLLHPRRTPCPLENVGNSCYANATLQAIFSLQMTEEFCSIAPVDDSGGGALVATFRAASVSRGAYRNP